MFTVINWCNEVIETFDEEHDALHFAHVECKAWGKVMKVKNEQDPTNSAEIIPRTLNVRTVDMSAPGETYDWEE